MRKVIIMLFAGLAMVLAPTLAQAGKIETNVSLSCYWISNNRYFHATNWVNIEGMTGTQWPTHKFVGKFRSDFIGPMTTYVDWNNVTKRQHMSVRGMSWGQVDFGANGTGGDNKAWAWRIETNGTKTPLTGIWYLYIDRDIRPGSYPKIQIYPQTRPANWFRGWKTSYFQVPFPQMAADFTRPKIVSNMGDFLPMGSAFRITKIGTNVHKNPAVDAFLLKHQFEVLDIGVVGKGVDIHLGLQYFEAEDMDKYGLWVPGASRRDTRGATIDVLGKYRLDGKFDYYDATGKVVRTGTPPPLK